MKGRVWRVENREWRAENIASGWQGFPMRCDKNKFPFNPIQFNPMKSNRINALGILPAAVVRGGMSSPIDPIS